MAEILFITPSDLYKYTPLTEQVDQTLIQGATVLAQDKYAEAYLGTDLFNALKTRVQNDNLTGAYGTLFYDYLQKALVWWTVMELIPSLVVKMDNGGLTIRQGEDFTTATQTEFKAVKDNAMNNAQMYTKRMVDWLCHNNASLPEYNTNTDNEISPKKQVYSENGMYFSSGNSAMSNPLLRSRHALDFPELYRRYYSQ
jgi:hypothetical protein